MRRARDRHAGALALALVAGLAPTTRARAEPDDAVYGRLDGDLALSAGLLAGAATDALRGDAWSASGSLELRARVVDTGGLVLGAELRPEGGSRLLVAADVRPLWLIRWLSGLSCHARFADLVIDSLGVDLGVALGPLEGGLGAALAVGVGVDVPLWLDGEGASGLYLRLATRYVGAAPNDSLAPAGGASDWVLLAGLGARFYANVGLAAWEPDRYRPETP